MKRHLQVAVMIAACLGAGVARGQEPAGDPQTTYERRPITEQQLRTYLTESLLLPASQQHIQDGLDRARKTMPPWFPDKVWLDVKRDVAAVDLVKLLLPLYQKFFTETDGKAMVLLFEGPTGQAYAAAALKSRLDAVNSGLEGSAAERAAMDSEAESNVRALQKKRIAELTPEELASLRSLGDASHKSMKDGLRLDDEQNVVLNKKMNEILQATLKAHNAELVAAQRAYAANH